MIEENGRSSRIMNSSRGIALVAYLIYTADPQSREKVADLLWESTSTRQSLTRLRELLARIRKSLPQLQPTRTTITFQPEDDDFIDLLLLRENLSDNNLAALDKALRLYEGNLLAGFYIEDAPYFNEWLVIVREQLRLQVMTAHHRLCQQYAEARNWARGIDLARRWLALEPLDEEAHRWLIEMLASDGQQTAAFQAYEACRQLLKDELGAEPDPATTELAMQVVTWNETAVAPFDFDTLEPLPTERLPEPGLLPRNAVLPYLRNPDFVGREKMLRAIATCLAQETEGGRSSVVAVTGLGGLGKTQTAVEFCYRYGRYFPGGVFWLNFADPENVADEATRIGGGRGMNLFQETDQLTLADKVGQVQRAWQDPIPRLLVFDNCETESLLADWLPVSGGSRVLITSRRGRWSRELGLTAIPLDALDPLESISLLQRLVPGLETDMAAEIAADVGHLPLALHLAGGFLRRYQNIQPARYLSQLRNKNLLRHPSLMGRGSSLSPTDHILDIGRTFAVTIDQLDLEDEVDRMAYRLLVHAACFAPGEPISQDLLRETAVGDGQDLTADLLAEDGLARLVALGFMDAEGAGSVVMHRLVAAFILQEIKTKARLESAQTAVETTMVRRLANELEDLIHIINLPIQPIHLRHITERALDRLSKSAGSLALVFGRHLRFNGEFDPAIKILNRGLAAAQANGDIHLQGCLTVIIARTYFSQGLHQLSQETTIEAERLLRLADSPDKGWLIRVLDRRAWAYLRLGQSKQALAAAEETRQLSTSQNDEFYLADAYNLLGSIYFFLLGEYEKADEYFEKAMELFIKSGRSGSVSTIMLNQAESAIAQGNYKKAKTLVQKAVPIIESAGKRLRALSARISLSEAQLRLGEFQEARENLLWLIDQAPENWTYLFVAYNVLAEVFLGLGQPEKALEIIQQVFSEMPMAQDPYDTGVSWRVLALIAAQQNQALIIKQNDEISYDAPTAFANSLAIFKEIENKREQGVTLWQWAIFERERGDEEKGQAMWEEARAIFSALNLPLIVVQMETQPG